MITAKNSRHTTQSLWKSLLKGVGLLTLVIIFALPQVMVGAQGPQKDDEGTELPDPAFTHFRIGSYHAVRGEWKEAIARFTKAIAADPKYGNAYEARGDCYVALGRYAEAIADYSQVLALVPEFPSVYYRRGRAYHASGKTGLAVADYQQSLSIKADYALSYWGLGDISFEQGEHDKALEYYHRYLTLVESTPALEVVNRVAALETQASALRNKK